MSLNRYRLLDLGLFALLLCLLEAACAWALGFFAGEAYTLSVTLFVSLLVMMRWGWPGVLHGALGGLVYGLLHGGGAVSLAAYAVGTAAVAVNLFWFTAIGRRRVCDSGLCTTLYCVTGFLAVCLGRAAVSQIAGGEPFFPTLVRFFSVDALTAIFTVLFLLIARKQNGLFEPQTDYLARLHREEEERKRGS